MLSFREYLSLTEATITASGPKAEGYVKKYIEPHIGSETPTHTMDSAHGKIPSGANVSIVSHSTDTDAKGKVTHFAEVKHHETGNVERVPLNKLNKPKGGAGSRSGTYNDEHAHANVWNHMVSKGIAHDKDAMMKELESAKTNKKHPLHFSNAKDEGFVGGKKTEEAKGSYHSELENAAHTIHALATHKDFKEAVENKHVAKVMGGERGDLSGTWKKHGAKASGAVSKADISIYDPKKDEHSGIKLSMKKGGGSQLMSGSPEENKAVHDHAVTKMLDEHPDYAKMSKKKKAEIHSNIMSRLEEANNHLRAMKGASRDKQKKHLSKGQQISDSIHDEHPALNSFVRREATTGEGKFAGGKGSASYLVTSSHGSKNATVKHADEIDFSGSRPRFSLPKGEGREGNVKLDQR